MVTQAAGLVWEEAGPVFAPRARGRWPAGQELWGHLGPRGPAHVVSMCCLLWLWMWILVFSLPIKNREIFSVVTQDRGCLLRAALV